jgi:hypothetical protein
MYNRVRQFPTRDLMRRVISGILDGKEQRD